MVSFVRICGISTLTNPDIFGNCTDGTCVKLAIVGKGADSDGYGHMDGFEGTFGGTLGNNLGNLPIITGMHGPETTSFPIRLPASAYMHPSPAQISHSFSVPVRSARTAQPVRQRTNPDT